MRLKIAREVVIGIVALVIGWSIATPAWAIPAFARREQLGCPICHTVFPELNAAGRLYKENGYHFADGQKPKTNGDDLGSGILIDKMPGIAFRIESVPVGVAPDDQGKETVFTQPLDAAELIAAGNSGKHWSYFAEIGSEAENDYASEGNGLVQYRVAQQLSLFAGWTPAFSRDGYNSLSESRRWDHADHAASDFAGSIDVPMNEEGGWVGAYGRATKLYYEFEAGPGAGLPDGAGEPLDYMGRVAIDLAKPLSVGAFVYSANTNTDNTVRVGGDLNAIGGFGTIKAVGMYDTLDQAVAIEAGWDVTKSVGKDNVNVMPEARVDVLSTSDGTSIAPTIGVGIQRSSGRIILEATEDVGGDTTPPPTAQLIVDAVF